jgi:hypothetical protein
MKKGILIVIIAFSFLAEAVYSQQASDSVIARNLVSVNSKADDYGAYVSRNGLTMYFVSNRFSKKTHIYVTKRKTLDAAWSEPEYCKVTPNPQDFIGALALDDVGRFYFSTNRESKDMNIWEGFGLDSTTTTRVLPGPVNTTFWEANPSVTRDGSDLYFVSNSQSPRGSMEVLIFTLPTGMQMEAGLIRKISDPKLISERIMGLRLFLLTGAFCFSHPNCEKVLK